MARIVLTVVADIPEGATTGPNYGDEALSPEFVVDYLRGAYIPDGAPMAELVPGLVVESVNLA